MEYLNIVYIPQLYSLNELVDTEKSLVAAVDHSKCYLV
jgi:hypothetical protein